MTRTEDTMDERRTGFDKSHDSAAETEKRRQARRPQRRRPRRLPGSAAIFMTLALVAGFVQTTESANAAEEETWKCCAGIFGALKCRDLPPDLTATANRDKGTGVVKLNGIAYDTQFNIEGFTRRWDWDWSEKLGGHQYAFIIDGARNGAYIEFKGEQSASPSLTFNCEPS